MGVEVLASEVVQNGFSGTEHEKENGVVAEPIKFGSNGDDVVISEVETAPDTTGPTNVADEWPAPKRTHSFYFIRYRPYDDPKIKARVDVADRELTRRNQRRSQLIDDLRAKKSERSEFINKLKELTSESRQYKEAADGRRKEMGPLQEALGQMRGSNNYGNRGAMICSSEEELNDAIYSLKYRIQHESIPLSEEKQLLREIKQLEGTREKVIANAATRTKIQESLGPKEDLQDKVKRITVDLNGVKKEQQAISAKIKALDEAKKAVDEEIKAIQDELTAVTEKREEAYQNIQELRRQNEGGNSGFYQNRDLLNKVKALCYKKDIQALEELAHTEVEKFMSSWCSSKAFRDDYEKRLLASLDNRQLSRDGRMRNPDEKPLVVVEVPKAPEPEVKPIVKRPKEDPKPSAQQDTLPAQKIEKEANGKPEDSKTTTKHDDIETEEIYGLEKSEVDVPKTKEMIREEEMAKAKQAVERKKKLAEKAAAKAAIRAQKEAEKKNKVLEKKLKKKAAASAPPTEANPEESAEVVGEEPAEPENAEASVEAPVTRPKNNKVRQRPRGKGPESLPKAILKRKKSTNYWVWAAPAIAVVLALVFAALGYRYLL